MSTTLSLGGPAHLFTVTHDGPTDATVACAVDDATIVTLTDNGDGTGQVAPLAEGNAALTATVTDPDGHVVVSAPFGYVVGPADTTTVTITDGGPVPTA